MVREKGNSATMVEGNERRVMQVLSNLYDYKEHKAGAYQLTASAGWYWATDYAYINTTLPYKLATPLILM